MNAANILIVEDEPLLALELSEELNKSGYGTFPVISSGDEVEEAVRRLNPDLIMMDIRIRGSIDGVEAARQLRREFDTPLIFLTAYSDRTTLNRAAAVRPDGYLLKPFNENEVLANIRLALEKHRLQRQGGMLLSHYIPVIDACPTALVLFDPEGRLFHLNLAANKILGLPDAEGWSGLKLEDLVTRTMDSGYLGTWPLQPKLTSGLQRALRVDSISDPAGTCRGYIGTIEDSHCNENGE